jgi:hypothetical protein
LAYSDFLPLFSLTVLSRVGNFFFRRFIISEKLPRQIYEHLVLGPVYLAIFIKKFLFKVEIRICGHILR